MKSPGHLFVLVALSIGLLSGCAAPPAATTAPPAVTMSCDRIRDPGLAALKFDDMHPENMPEWIQNQYNLLRSAIQVNQERNVSSITSSLR